MPLSDHTYGPTCHLAREDIKGDTDVPPLKTQFFYTSPLPIDDPLTAIPTTSSDPKAAKHSPRPFSPYDNNALEEAWLALGSTRCKNNHRKLSPSSIRSLTNEEAQRRTVLISELAAKHNKKHEAKQIAKNDTLVAAGSIPCIQKSEDKLFAIPGGLCCSELEKDVKCEENKRVAGIKWKPASNAEREALLSDIMAEQKSQASNTAESNKCSHIAVKTGDSKPSDSTDKGEGRCAIETHHSAAPEGCEDHGLKSSRTTSCSSQNDDRASRDLKATDPSTTLPSASGPSEIGTTGFPFQRAPSRSVSPILRPPTPDTPSATQNEDISYAENQNRTLNASFDDQPPEIDETVLVYRCKAREQAKDIASIPVGISRLHLVKLPLLQMMPIYWSPVHDISAVIRGTWFYRDSMYPVESAVANQLEMGYRELRPWSQTWNDELTSALTLGADGEEKISHRLWPRDDKQPHIEIPPSDPHCAARCFGGEVAAEGKVDPLRPDEKNLATTEIIRRYPNSHVIYKDWYNAYILKPSLQPSAYYGRKPLSKIKKDMTVGIHVVRGFKWSSWEKIHPGSKSALVSKAEESAPASDTANAGKRAVCDACAAQQVPPKVTDLVLVIHGIGQKLSERVESFHFTHAINSFRRAINVELANESVQAVLRKDLGGIMVLPVNWRSNLSFEEGGPMRASDKGKDAMDTGFSLKDITPDTIPTIRNLISDVMLDIPFYMSHHKPKMIEALVYEANRVYRLWCQNNPNFHQEGRVHIIAHSLGSAMALEVLSKQPTILPNSNLNSKKMQTKHFDFDTKNLFFVGSPAGFFLLLEKGMLMPRKGRKKPGAENDDQDGGVASNAGKYGCLAVDNLYNVMVRPSIFISLQCAFSERMLIHLVAL